MEKEGGRAQDDTESPDKCDGKLGVGHGPDGLGAHWKHHCKIPGKSFIQGSMSERGKCKDSWLN